MARIRRRTRGTLDDDARRLAAAYVPLARRIARPSQRRWPGLHDDIESAAMMALVEAAESYDPARGLKFVTLARRRIAGAILDVQRRQALLGYRSHGAHADQPGVEALSARSRPASPCVDAARIDEDDAFEALVRPLPARLADLCRLVYRDDLGQSGAGAAIGLSQSRVSHLLTDAHRMIRDGAIC